MASAIWKFLLAFALVPNEVVLSQYRNQFNSLRAAVCFWTASMSGNSSEAQAALGLAAGPAPRH